MTLASFFRFKVKIPGVSVELSAADEGQFTDAATSADTAKFGFYCMNIFEMKNYAGAFSTRERGMYGLHYINVTSGALDTTWTSADFAAAESALQGYWSAGLADFSSGVRLVEHRWYPFGPGFVGTKSSPLAPARVTTLATPLQGTGSSPWIRQVGTTVTMRTTLRKHWGRIYLPMASANYTQEGQFSSAVTDLFAARAKAALTGAETSQGVVPVVYDRARKQVYGVIAYEMDSVPDIQRRRRPRDPGYKKIITS